MIKGIPRGDKMGRVLSVTGTFVAVFFLLNLFTAVAFGGQTHLPGRSVADSRMSHEGLFAAVQAAPDLEQPVTQPTGGSFTKSAQDRLMQGALPLQMNFIENRGQKDSRVRYYSQQGGMTVWFTDTEIVFDALRPKPAGKKPSSLRRGLPHADKWADAAGMAVYERQVTRMKLKGANLKPQVTARDRQDGTYNYFIGNDRSKWRSGVPAFGEVYYRDVYAGIDLKFYARNGAMEYDFIARPGADISRISVAFEGIDGIKKAANGDLLIKTAFGDIIQKAPHIYQAAGGKTKEIAGGFRISDPDGKSYGFRVDPYDTKYALVIDPELVYSIVKGGTVASGSLAIALNGEGCAYVTGWTSASDFPTTTGAYDTSFNGNYDAAIFKLSADGKSTVFSTFFGGSGFDFGYGIALDGSGNIYVAGSTSSSDLPVTSDAYQSLSGGNSDAFILKLNPSGSSLLYSTYLGGSDNDYAYGVAVDGSGNAYVTGTLTGTLSTTVNAYQSSNAGYYDAFILMLASDNTVGYFSYLGGSQSDEGYGIAVDETGYLYVTGYTNSSDFPTVNDNSSWHGYNSDVFITKIKPDGSAPVFSTRIGGAYEDMGKAIALDASGNVYVAGHTYLNAFPVTAGAYQTTAGGGYDAFILKLNIGDDGGSLIYATYLGGSGDDYAYSVAVDGFGCAYVAGKTASEALATVNAYQSTYGGGSDDAFVAKLSPDGNAAIYLTYLGGTYADYNEGGMAVDASGNAYIPGYTVSSNFPKTATGASSGMSVTKLRSEMARTLINSSASARYYTLQAAYDSFSTGSDTKAIEAVAAGTTETFLLDSDIDVSITGGYDGSYSSSSNYTILKGTMTIQKGSATVGNLIIR
jgi:hypothetical protein